MSTYAEEFEEDSHRADHKAQFMDKTNGHLVATDRITGVQIICMCK